jgi:hypothetical protein
MVSPTVLHSRRKIKKKKIILFICLSQMPRQTLTTRFRVISTSMVYPY